MTTRPAWADNRKCSDCPGNSPTCPTGRAFTCGMPYDDGSTHCEREFDIRMARDQIHHQLAILVSLDAIDVDTGVNVMLTIGGDT